MPSTPGPDTTAQVDSRGRTEEGGARPIIDIRQRLGKRSLVPAETRAIPTPLGFTPREVPTAPTLHRVRDLTVHVDADVAETRRRTRRVVVVATVVAITLGLALGHLWGNAAAQNRRWQRATAGAKQLSAEIATAHEQVEALATAVSRLQRSLDSGPIVAPQVAALRNVNLAFNGSQLVDRGMGSFKGDLQRRLIEYMALTRNASWQQERLAQLLGKRERDQLATLAAHRDSPRVYWTVSVDTGPRGSVAQVVRLAEPFEQSSEWPRELRVSTIRGTETAPRLVGQHDMGRRDGVIPVDPATLGPIKATQLRYVIHRQLRDLAITIAGDGAEQRGLKQLGADLGAALDAVGG